MSGQNTPTPMVRAVEFLANSRMLRRIGEEGVDGLRALVRLAMGGKLDMTTIIQLVALGSAVLKFGKSAWTRLRTAIELYYTSELQLGSQEVITKAVTQWLTSRVRASSTNFIGKSTNPKVTLSETDELNSRQVTEYTPDITGRSHVVWRHGRRFVFTVDRYHSMNPGALPGLKISCWGRSIEPIKSLIRDIERDEASYVAENSTMQIVTHREDDGYWSERQCKPKRGIETVDIETDLKKSLIADAADFFSPETVRFYQSTGVPHRRGYLLWGPPGTGKTSLCQAIASYFDLSLYICNIAGVDGPQLLELFEGLPGACVIVLEDIDSAGIGREHTVGKGDKARGKASMGDEDEVEDSESSPGSSGDKKTSRITLSTLLNCIDGAAAKDGRLLIMTSNTPEELDEALIRPGRIDMTFRLGYMSHASIESMFVRFFKHYAAKDVDVPAAAKAFAAKIPENKFTPAQIQGYMVPLRKSIDEALAGAEKFVADMEKPRFAKASDHEDLGESQVSRNRSRVPGRRARGPQARGFQMLTPTMLSSKYP